MYPTNVCSVNSNMPIGFCRGDSGGPLSVDGKVVGVVSYSLNNGCAEVIKEPQVYTRMSEFISWINSSIQDNTDSPLPNEEVTENTDNWENGNNNNENGINNPTNDFNDWINSQDLNDPNWINNLNEKYKERNFTVTLPSLYV